MRTRTASQQQQQQRQQQHRRLSLAATSSATVVTVAVAALTVLAPSPTQGFVVPPTTAISPAHQTFGGQTKHRAASSFFSSNGREGYRPLLGDNNFHVDLKAVTKQNRRRRFSLALTASRTGSEARASAQRQLHSDAFPDGGFIEVSANVRAPVRAAATRLQATAPENGSENASSSTTPGGGRRGEGDKPWRTVGDVPSLVLGVGLLVARQRREIRATKERKVLASSRTEEDAAAYSRVGQLAGVAATGAVGTRTENIRQGDASRMRRYGRYGSPQAAYASSRSGKVALGERGQVEEAGDEEEGVPEERDETGQGMEVAEERPVYRREVERGEKRRYTPEQQRGVSPRVATLDVSLDRSVMVEPVGPLMVWGTVVAAMFGVVAVGARLPRALGAVRNTVSQTVEPAYQHSRLPVVVGDVRYNARLLGGSLRAWGSRRAEAWDRAFGPEDVVLPADDWSVCTLLERNREGGNVLRYRFGLQASPNAVLPLELGQELSLCGLDGSNQVVNGNFVPLTPRKQRGFFDIVVRRHPGEMDDGLTSTRSDIEFSRFLDNLPVGDEIAVKPGREGLVYAGPYSPITDLVLIATGLGVVPMVQMVNELLPSSDSSVSAASVIWLNEKAEDFVLYGALEKAFFRNHRKLDVSCIVERDLFGHQLGDNANVQESAPDFKIGTLAAISGPEFFKRKVTDYLIHRGYPEEVIITL